MKTTRRIISQQPESSECHRKWVRLIFALLSLLIFLSTPGAFAAGTAADTVISNSASVTFTMNEKTQTLNSNASTFKVDDKLSFTLTATNAANVTITAGGRAYMSYIITNTGNATHDFTLEAAVTGTPTLTPATGPIFYADEAGTVPLQTDTNAGNLPYIGSLAPDASRTVFLAITAPAQLTDGKTLHHIVTAEAFQMANLGIVIPPVKSSLQAATDAVVNKNENLMTRHIVLADRHGNGGDADRDGRYAVVASDGNGSTIGFMASSALVNVVKSVTATDRFGGNQPMTGATLHYALSVSVVGSGAALGLVITDPIPASTSYSAGTLKLNGISLSDTKDSDAGDIGVTTPGSVSVSLGDMTNASPFQVITFDVIID